MSKQHDREWWKERLPLIQAFAEGKCIENVSINGKEWIAMTALHFESPVENYRIAPEPKLRPWKLEEVPVGAIVRQKSNPQNRVLITAVVDGTVWSGKIQDSKENINDWEAFTKCEHSTDGGATWKPCGVLESQV